MEKHSYVGKTKEDAIKEAVIDLQEVEENLIINEISSKTGLFKKTEIEVIEKREVVKFIKSKIHELLKDMGINANIETKVDNNIAKYTIVSDQDALVIGKNGKNLQALSTIINQIVLKETNHSLKFIIDVGEYKFKRERNLERLAKNVAREVKATKVEAKLDSMNSYERRIIHNTLKDYKYVYTESVGEEPNRAVVIKPKED
ncbi:MAG: R3H domain-containing nucleic acid-binding protein [bacterium]|nr:R3H domain-containing nucleic acid-binding protein [bacterium]